MFSIISYYQDQPASTSGPCQMIVPKECATLGLETETIIGTTRAYSEMRTFMSRHEAHVVRVFLKNSNIRHWNEFRHCMDILESAGLSAKYDDQSQFSRKSPTPPSSFYCNNPDFLAWVASESVHRELDPFMFKSVPRYLSLALKNSADPARLLNGVATAIRETPDALWIASPSITLSSPVGVPPSKGWILAFLIHQLLTQQPQAFLYIRHLLPNLVDAMRSDMQTWKERCLWLCLRTLIHSPIGVTMYGFLYVDTKESIEILHQINSAVDFTDSRFRLALVFAPGVETKIRHSYFLRLDIPSSDDPSANDLNSTVKDMALLSHSDWEGLPLEKLRISLGAVDRTGFIALTWIAFATRPLSLEELQAAAALDQSPGSSAKSDNDEEGPFVYEKSSGIRLRDLLPGVIEIHSNCVFLCLPYLQIRDVLSSLKAPGYGIDDDWSPHLYLAEKCLEVVRGIRESRHNQLTIGLTEYAARNWIHHYELAGKVNTGSTLGALYSDFISEESTVQSWLTFVEHLSLLPAQRQESLQAPLNITEPRLKCLLDIGSLEDLKTLAKLASRPSTLTGVGRLLVHAAETTNKETLDRICREPFSPDQVKEVSRALATSHGTIHDSLMDKASSILDEHMTVRMQLEALVLGNALVSENLVSTLSLIPSAGECGLVADVLISGVEYDDEKVIDVCNSYRDVPWRHNISLTGSSLDGGKDSGNWTVLHATAKYGCRQVISGIIEFDFLNDISSTQGRLDSITILLCNGANPTPFDVNSDYPLHLAIRQGHSRVVESLVDYLPVKPSPHRGAMFGLSSAPLNWNNRYGAAALAETVAQELVGMCRLILQKGGDPNILDATGKVALHLAAKAGSAGMVRDLIDRGSKTNQMTLGFRLTPMHYACYRGATEVVELLLGLTDLNIEDYWGRTPISAAAYSGHLATVKLLYASYDDRERAKALCAAAGECHHDIVEYLLNLGCPIDGVGSDPILLAEK
ncbi:hypothetical protein ONZ43_g2455 [Nemania bipapillata]|uniref:Uncharacterized protein n=1 Tax=Nemania bipapillata TaxID=110536 RepID=A0ACC2J0J9_9PEZI|nr:hypothetical protein ONZ43_g2455 [Nemania bipapillata]